jgi:predicted signal transduction protein with EAL and GGDEF domain
VLVECSVEKATLDLLADRMTESLREPVDLDGDHNACSVTASIGVVIGQYNTAEELLRNADLALYSAKAAGKDRYTLFDPSMQTGTQARLGFEAELSTALEQRQFFLLYQPICDLLTHEMVGVEALIRWQHPTRGVVTPHSFIGLAEKSGMIAPIGR